MKSHSFNVLFGLIWVTFSFLNASEHPEDERCNWLDMGSALSNSLLLEAGDMSPQWGAEVLDLGVRTDAVSGTNRFHITKS